MVTVRVSCSLLGTAKLKAMEIEASRTVLDLKKTVVDTDLVHHDPDLLRVSWTTRKYWLERRVDCYLDQYFKKSTIVASLTSSFALKKKAVSNSWSARIVQTHPWGHRRILNYQGKMRVNVFV